MQVRRFDLPPIERKPMSTHTYDKDLNEVHHDGSPERDVHVRLRMVITNRIFNRLGGLSLHEYGEIAELITSDIERDPLLKVELREHVPTLEEGITAIIEREFGQFGNAHAQSQHAARKIMQTIELNKRPAGEPENRYPYVMPHDME
jgi:hypothetical protein